MLTAAPSLAAALTVSQFGQLALQCGATVAPLTLAAVARTESRFDPLTIHDNTTGVTGAPETPAIAEQLAAALLEAGHSVDLGLMQINSANFARLGLTPAAAFDPCRSIAAAATILTGDYAGGDTHAAQQAALRSALSSYNTGDPVRGIDNGYVHKVELSASAVVPAIDVATSGPAGAPVIAAPASPPAPTPAPLQPIPVSYDPDAPPVWDVWGSFDHASSGHAAPGRGDVPAGDPAASAAGVSAAPDLQHSATGAP